MKIFWPDPHKNLTKRISQALNALGHTIILPSPDYKVTHYGFTRPDWVWATNWSRDFCKENIKYGNYLSLNKKEILDLKPDICFIPHFEAQFEVLYELLPKLPKSTKLCYFSGNCYKDPYYYGFYNMKNFLYADAISHRECQKHQIPHTLYYRPYQNYDLFKYTPYNRNDSTVGNFTCNFEADWKEGHTFSKACENAVPEAKFEYDSTLSESEVADKMANCLATTSYKSQEGFGMSSVESAASGRPVFLLKQYNQDKSYLQWLIEGETAFYVSSVQEFRAKLKALIDSPDYRNWVHYNCAQKIRQYINNEEETTKLGNFLENLQ